MEKEIFNKMFNERTDSIRLSINERDCAYGNRIGDYAPVFFNDLIISQNGLGDFYYYFTINSNLLPIAEDLEISVFYPKEFKQYNENNKYPDFEVPPKSWTD